MKTIVCESCGGERTYADDGTQVTNCVCMNARQETTATREDVAALDAMLAQIDADFARSLEAVEGLPHASQAPARQYIDLQQRMRRTIAMWQFEMDIKIPKVYRQMLIGLANDTVVSALSAEKKMGRAERMSIFLESQKELFKRLLRLGMLPIPTPGNVPRVLDAAGKPMKRTVQ